MRPIDADALKKTLAELTVKGKNTKEVEGGIKVLRIMPQVIDDEPTIEAEPVNRWISVENGLPKDSEKVLCLTIGNFYGVLLRIDDGWCCPLTSQEFYTDFVKYWQPLPKPPEKSKKEA